MIGSSLRACPETGKKLASRQLSAYKFIIIRILHPSMSLQWKYPFKQLEHWDQVTLSGNIQWSMTKLADFSELASC